MTTLATCTHLKPSPQRPSPPKKALLCKIWHARLSRAKSRYFASNIRSCTDTVNTWIEMSLHHKQGAELWQAFNAATNLTWLSTPFGA